MNYPLRRKMPKIDNHDGQVNDLPIPIEKLMWKPAIKMAQWRKVQGILDKRGEIKHRRAPRCAMLFTGRIFCDCGSVMYGTANRPSGKAYFFCHATHSGKAKCKLGGGELGRASSGFLVAEYEQRFLLELCGLSTIVPRNQPALAHKLVEQHAKAADRLKSRIKNRDLLNDGVLDKETAATVRKYNLEITELRAKIEQLAGEIAEAKAPTSRRDEVWSFIRSHVNKLNDLEVRQEIREKLAGIGYAIRYDGKLDGFTITVDGVNDEVFIPALPPLVHLGRLYLSLRRKRGDKREIDGVMRTYKGYGWWEGKDGSTIRRGLGRSLIPLGVPIKVKGKTYIRVRGGWYREEPPPEDQDPDEAKH
jgi:hypothetical protein